ncbi:hypothetical protein L6452_30911 [Arctium lappa]|uniref:Uncharacterized protein n=1 Tax=Arctium lappa TaxID=4217 RepID=A0ACB8ZIL0_ARCLA|nr:hypothetical protein L6452_30911 [Arctium lappa]
MDGELAIKLITRTMDMLDFTRDRHLFTNLEIDISLLILSHNIEWGDHASTNPYGVKILVLTSFKDTSFIEILPKVLKSKRGNL